MSIVGTKYSMRDLIRDAISLRLWYGWNKVQW